MLHKQLCKVMHLNLGKNTLFKCVMIRAKTVSFYHFLWTD